jgi:hypothetical protein
MIARTLLTACLTVTLGVALFGAAFFVRPVAAQDGYPYSIMREEPGTRVRKPDLGWEKDLKEPAKKPVVRRGRIGSSSPSPLPPVRSVVTPLGTAPRIVETPSMGTPASPGMIVPGMRATTGPAITPSRPAGQSFQDRAVNCVHSGSAQGVGPGQIGAFTQSCVNQ